MKTGKSNIELKVIALTKSYKKKPNAIKNINLELYSNEALGLLGPNGAGKTTLIKCISGLTSPEEGVIKASRTSKKKKLKNFVSVVLEGNRNLYWQLSVIENIEFFMALKKMSFKDNKYKIETELKRFNLYDKINEIVGKLSKGMQQKLSLLIAILDDAPIIILDEPTLGLDVDGVDELVKMIREISSKEGKSLLLCSHDMRFIERTCERVAFINNGEIIQKSLVSELSKLNEVSYAKILTKAFDVNLLSDILVKDIRTFNSHSEIKVELIDSDLNNVIKQILKYNISILKVEIEGNNLEDVFRKIMAKEVKNVIHSDI